ncbi:hypothetical protein Tco_1528452, partial [Tanacetum coccineum]
SSSIPADNVPAGSSSSIPADYVSAGHVLNPMSLSRIETSSSTESALWDSPLYVCFSVFVYFMFGKLPMFTAVALAMTNSCCKDWKLLFFNVAACLVAVGYLVSAGSCFCCYSILLLREDL